MENPYAVKNSQDGQMLQIYLGSSPSPFCPNGRSDDLSILTHAISQADEFVYVAVSDYAPMNVFGKDRKPWPILDDLLREGLCILGCANKDLWGLCPPISIIVVYSK